MDDIADVVSESEDGPPMTLRNAAAAHVRLIVWCKASGHRVNLTPPKWRDATAPRLLFPSRISGSSVLVAGVSIPDMVVTSERRLS